MSYGVYGHATGEGATYAGFFAGDVEVTGTLAWGSDRKLKEGIEGLGGSGVLAKLMRLKPRKYKYKRDRRGKRLGFTDRTRYGLVAQEVEAVFPELVSERRHVLPSAEEAWDGAGAAPSGPSELVAYKALNYVDLIPLLVQALQEQQALLTAQQALLKGQQAEIEALKRKVQQAPKRK